MKAMVFDDDALICSLLGTMLRRRGYTVEFFSDPSFCPLMGQKECPHRNGGPCANVIITDIQMLEVNGLDFLEDQLKKGCKCKHIAVISGRWTEESLNRARKLGVRIIAKPFRANDIDAWLDEVARDSDRERDGAGKVGRIPDGTALRD
jgi:DNA-binding response OmpR family regulator